MLFCFSAVTFNHGMVFDLQHNITDIIQTWIGSSPFIDRPLSPAVHEINSACSKFAVCRILQKVPDKVDHWHLAMSQIYNKGCCIHLAPGNPLFVLLTILMNPGGHTLLPSRGVSVAQA